MQGAGSQDHQALPPREVQSGPGYLHEPVVTNSSDLDRGGVSPGRVQSIRMGQVLLESHEWKDISPEIEKLDCIAESLHLTTVTLVIIVPTHNKIKY